ncbi:MAG: hypothetical protein HC773_29075 [Scytonema sp. CRU_2_7]|nr:hypothetical protein [Scytonema sp. CRU_2_7]
MKTRFSPSPTGQMHLGNVRTALFSYLLAHHDKGTFLLRIEDTDKINLTFPLLFLSKIINKNEEYEKRYKESIIFDLEKQEILSRRNYHLFQFSQQIRNFFSVYHQT